MMGYMCESGRQRLFEKMYIQLHEKGFTILSPKVCYFLTFLPREVFDSLVSQKVPFLVYFGHI